MGKTPGEGAQPPWGVDVDRETAEEERAKDTEASQKQRERAIRLLMTDEAGREFLRDIIRFCGVFSVNTPSDALTMAYKEGMRNCGLRIYGELEHNAPDLVALLNKTG